MAFNWARAPLFLTVLFTASSSPGAAEDDPAVASIQRRYVRDAAPLLKTYCFECHSGDRTEAEIDLSAFRTLEEMRENVGLWIKVRSMLRTRQMPPKDAQQLPEAKHRLMLHWVSDFLRKEAESEAGDPGAVVLRRLSNAEYTYSIRDLTELTALDPTEQFPVDGAAGEGFTNTGSGLVMSPALVQKYLDAAKRIAGHAALLPDRIVFRTNPSKRDLTDEWLARIQALYARYSRNRDQANVNLWGGSAFQTGEAGVLDVRPYLEATLVERDALHAGKKSVANVARERGLSEPYLGRLWQTLNAEPNRDSFLLQELRERWRNATAQDSTAVVEFIEQLRPRLWKYNVVGHIGREGAPASWMEPVDLLTDRQAFELPLTPPSDASEVVVHLSAGTADDGHDEHDFVLWRDAYLQAEGSPPIPLQKVQGIALRRKELQQELLREAEKYLAAAAEITTPDQLKPIAAKHDLKPDLLHVWSEFAGVKVGGPIQLEGHYTEQVQNGNYNFVRGWGTHDTPSVIANSSDQQVRIPGIARPHSIMVHPSPTLFSAVAWRSPVDTVVEISASVLDAHPECGNGVEWFLQQQTSGGTVTLWKGAIGRGQKSEMMPQTLPVGQGEVIALLIGPRDGVHACDLTEVRLRLAEASGDKRVWDLAGDVSDTVQKANPHADRFGHAGVWHFLKGPMTAIRENTSSVAAIPAGSLMALWQENPDRRPEIARQIAKLIRDPLPAGAENSPDGLLRRQLLAMRVPLSSSLLDDVPTDERFGRHVLGHRIDSGHIVVRAPHVLNFRIPAELAAGRSLVVAGMPCVEHGREGSVQLNVGLTAEIPATHPVVCSKGSEAEERVRTALADFRNLFPLALCYSRIVPIDEVVTAVLFHREDEPYMRLMLTADERSELERLWKELYYVAEIPLKQVVALEQIRAFSTQDRQELVGLWDGMKPQVLKRADEFRAYVVSTESTHLDSLMDFAARSWRRPLRQDESDALRRFYHGLRSQELPHDEAIRLTLARVLTSPAFLYKLEQPGTTVRPVSQLELASRLSYFLWSSLPDRELRQHAEQGTLTNDELLRQTKRMLQDEKARRMAIHFMCQWLHLRDFDRNDDKNEKLYPEFARLRGDMYEETVRFCEDMIRNNGPVLDVIDGNHRFLNEVLARHYGLPFSGDGWQRITGLRKLGRGGIPGMATFLASQSGASRTSPILRGNWISETLLGEKLPRPPADVPQLPESVPDGLSARQLIERHSSDPACAKCHARIDPFGFALEQFDAIGRRRKEEVDARTQVFDGRQIEGILGLQNYLVDHRYDDVVRQFCRKLLGYALGREVQLSDEPLIDDMLKKLENRDFRIHIAIESVVLSQQFQSIRGNAVE